MRVIQVNIDKVLRTAPGVQKVLYTCHIKYIFSSMFTGKCNHLLTQEHPMFGSVVLCNCYEDYALEGHLIQISVKVLV